ncbi:DUF3892 domain-containing protein [Pseudomonas cichorii]|nr:DUF3892 domain-containing protein [Pseudomonas cichorii]MBX8580620.1 DUF3892 domain-containing protein [Pseudomonas cichorii]
MTDFYISAIQKDTSQTHIEKVRVHKVNGDHFGSGLVTDREFVANLIDLGHTTFKTIVENKTTGKWNIGAVIHVTDGNYLTTDPNKTKKDNLGNLPNF